MLKTSDLYWELASTVEDYKRYSREGSIDAMRGAYIYIADMAIKYVEAVELLMDANTEDE